MEYFHVLPGSQKQIVQWLNKLKSINFYLLFFSRQSMKKCEIGYRMNTIWNKIRNIFTFSSMYLEVLNLLHSQVSSTTGKDLATDYQYYLQVMKKASLQEEISPQVSFWGTLKWKTKYLTVETIQISNIKIVERSKIDASKTQICDNSLSCLWYNHFNKMLW